MTERERDRRRVVAAARASAGTVVIDFRVEQEDSVYPMVPGGRRPARHDPPARAAIVETSDSSEHRSIELRTFVAYVEDQPGVLNRVTSLFRRRGYNIESLTVGRTERAGRLAHDRSSSRPTTTSARRIEANLYKLVNVLCGRGHDARGDGRRASWRSSR